MILLYLYYGHYTQSTLLLSKLLLLIFIYISLHSYKLSMALTDVIFTNVPLRNYSHSLRYAAKVFVNIKCRRRVSIFTAESRRPQNDAHQFSLTLPVSCYVVHSARVSFTDPVFYIVAPPSPWSFWAYCYCNYILLK